MVLCVSHNDIARDEAGRPKELGDSVYTRIELVIGPLGFFEPDGDFRRPPGCLAL